MPSPQLIEGGVVDTDLRRILRDELGVNLFGQILDWKLTSGAAKQARQLHEAIRKGRYGNKDIVYPVDDRISCIRWQCSETEDLAFANEIAGVTGIAAQKVL